MAAISVQFTIYPAFAFTDLNSRKLIAGEIIQPGDVVNDSLCDAPSDWRTVSDLVWGLAYGENAVSIVRRPLPLTSVIQREGERWMAEI